MNYGEQRAHLTAEENKTNDHGNDMSVELLQGIFFQIYSTLELENPIDRESYNSEYNELAGEKGNSKKERHESLTAAAFLVLYGLHFSVIGALPESGSIQPVNEWK